MALGYPGHAKRVLRHPTGFRAIRRALVWKSTWQNAKGLAVQGAPDRPDDALWVNERYGLIYKRVCQEHFSPSAGCGGLVRDIQPISLWKTLV
jgi:hypothetical protein